MQTLTVLVLAILSQGDAVSPVQKVMKLLEDLRAKGNNEIKAEQVAYSTFNQWCNDVIATKQTSIATSQQEIEELNADIAKASSDIETSSNSINQLVAHITQAETDKEAATALRAEEHKTFEASHQDLSESVDALQRAVIVMKKHSADKEQQPILLSKVMKLNRLPAKARRVLAAFVQQPTELSNGTPEVDAYEFQSGGIINMLEELLAKFTDEKSQTIKEEMNAKHAYDMNFQDLVGQVRSAEADKSRKIKARGVAQKNLGVAQGDLRKTSEMKSEDEKYLAQTDAMCKVKTSEFGQRQELRKAEVDAITKALEILGSASVAGHEQTYAPGVKPTAVSFLQLNNHVENPNQSKALAFLISQAHKLNSQVLSQLTEHAAEDPFQKVKKMIWDMIQKLTDQQSEEAEHKGWCEKEMKVNEQVRTQKQNAVDSLQSNKEMLSANIEKLTTEVTDLTAEVAALDQARTEATAERSAEKKTNTKTVSDSQEAQQAVSAATKVLKEFYAKAGTATAFLEDPQDDAPATWTESYTGQQDSSVGVFALLEVIMNDFAKLEAETKSEEEDSKRVYQNMMAETEKDRAVKQTMISNKTTKKTEQASALKDTVADLLGTTEQLEAAVRYHERLQPSCVYQPVSFEERTKKREEEIYSLKTALKLLSGQQTD